MFLVVAVAQCLVGTQWTISPSSCYSFPGRQPQWQIFELPYPETKIQRSFTYHHTGTTKTICLFYSIVVEIGYTKIWDENPRFKLDCTYAVWSQTLLFIAWSEPLLFIARLSPIALRNAKIVYNFGLSECNWVNMRKELKHPNIWDRHFQGKQLFTSMWVSFCFLPQLEGTKMLCENEFCSRVDPVLEGINCQGKQTGIHRSCLPL